MLESVSFLNCMGDAVPFFILPSVGKTAFARHQLSCQWFITVLAHLRRILEGMFAIVVTRSDR